jgi:hypothetical protein
VNAHERGNRSKLERLEAEYANITDGDALITAESTETTRFKFADGAEAVGTEDAVKQGEALVKFARRHTRP